MVRHPRYDGSAAPLPCDTVFFPHSVSPRDRAVRIPHLTGGSSGSRRTLGPPNATLRPVLLHRGPLSSIVISFGALGPATSLPVLTGPGLGTTWGVRSLPDGLFRAFWCKRAWVQSQCIARGGGFEPISLPFVCCFTKQGRAWTTSYFVPPPLSSPALYFSFRHKQCLWLRWCRTGMTSRRSASLKVTAPCQTVSAGHVSGPRGRVRLYLFLCAI
jgi:hypothetical protein